MKDIDHEVDVVVHPGRLIGKLPAMTASNSGPAWPSQCFMNNITATKIVAKLEAAQLHAATCVALDMACK